MNASHPLEPRTPESTASERSDPIRNRRSFDTRRLITALDLLLANEEGGRWPDDRAHIEALWTSGCRTLHIRDDASSLSLRKLVGAYSR